MSELNPKLYFRVYLFALLFPLASGELSIIYNELRGHFCSDQTSRVLANVAIAVILQRRKFNMTLHSTAETTPLNGIGKFETSNMANYSSFL